MFYDFDLISGKVNQVSYQVGYPDAITSAIIMMRRTG